MFADPTTEDKFDGHRLGAGTARCPAIAGAVAYLRCRRAARFDLYDHTILIGDVEDGRHEGGEPLVYLERHMGWRLETG